MALPPPHGGALIDQVLRGAALEQARARVSTLPRIELDDDGAWDTVDIATGVFSPLTGFMGQRDVQSVVETGRLANGLPWTIPILLDVADEQARGLKDTVCLCYRGQPWALLEVAEVFRFNTTRLAQGVFATTDAKHPGVSKALALKPHFVAGTVRLLGEVRHEYARYHLYPSETRTLFQELGWNTVVGFQTRNVPHLGHEYVQKAALTFVDGLFINPVMGRKKKGDFRDEVILESCEALIKSYYPANRATMAILPFEMRYAGPREAIFHAIVRKNFGCTHFIVGRDHAGVGSYYTPYAAHEIFKSYPDLGITPMFFTSFFYCLKCHSVTSDKVCPHTGSDRLEFSGTLLRNLVSQKKLPEYELIRKEVADVVLAHTNPFVE